MSKTTTRIALATFALAGVAGIRGLYAQPAAVTGDAQGGAPLFSDKYNCYACHGFDAQSGERRLIPMNYPQEGFITFVQNSPLPNMPRFPDATPQELADIWAYIKSIQTDAPAIDDLPALREIRDKQQASLGK